jgi:hypothetical protein
MGWWYWFVKWLLYWALHNLNNYTDILLCIIKKNCNLIHD